LRLVLMSWLRARRGGAPGGAEMYSSHGTPANHIILVQPLHFYRRTLGLNLGLLRNSQCYISSLLTTVPCLKVFYLGKTFFLKRKHFYIESKFCHSFCINSHPLYRTSQ
jgi:hypothetical protein